MVKYRGTLKLSIFDRELKRQQIENFVSQRAQSAKNDDEDGLDLQGAYADDLDCLPANHLVTKLEVRIKNVFAVQMISKVLLTDQNKTALCVRLITSHKGMQLCIHNLQTMKIVFRTTFEHTADDQFELSQNLTCSSLEQVRPQIE